MGRRPCCKKQEVKIGAWTAEEDRVLIDVVRAHGEGRWGSVPKKAGLNRCGKSCRFRWLNYLRPGIKRGNISPDEEDLILRLHKLLGNRWSLIAGRLPGRTDNEIKNYWNTILYKRAQDDNHPKFKKPKLGHNPDQSEGTMKLELEENDNTIGKPCNSTLQSPLLESEQSASLATFWAETLKLSEVDISRQLSLRQDEDYNHCLGISEGAPRPCPPSSGGTPTKSENAEVEKNGSTIGLLSGFHPEVEGSKDAAEDPVLGFDIGDVCLLDLLNSELLVGNSSSSTPSDPQLAFPSKERMVQDCNMIADSHQADHDAAPADHVINSLSSLFLFDNPEGELLDKREQDK